MGLTVAHRIVGRYSGKLTTQSAPNQGATFIITMPMKQGNGRPPKMSEKARAITILVADDDADADAFTPPDLPV